MSERAEAAVAAALGGVADPEARFALLCALLRAAARRIGERAEGPGIVVDLLWPHGSVRLFSSDRSAA